VEKREEKEVFKGLLEKERKEMEDVGKVGEEVVVNKKKINEKNV
jgi:hypothetical protein